jgi:hypothetical protein
MALIPAPPVLDPMSDRSSIRMYGTGATTFMVIGRGPANDSRGLGTPLPFG